MTDPVFEVMALAVAFADRSFACGRLAGEDRVLSGAYEERATEADSARDELEAKVRELEKDAARYRWLRDHSEPGICAFYLSVGKAFDGVRFTKPTVDEAIDAQIALQALNDQAQELGLYSGEKP